MTEERQEQFNGEVQMALNAIIEATDLRFQLIEDGKKDKENKKIKALEKKVSEMQKEIDVLKARSNSYNRFEAMDLEDE